MRYSSLDRGFPAGNPIASALVIVVGSLIIAASIVVGFFAFVIVGSLLLMVAAAVSIRLWWLRRKAEKDPAVRAARAARGRSAHQTIEGEYHVVVDDKEGHRG